MFSGEFSDSGGSSDSGASGDSSESGVSGKSGVSGESGDAGISCESGDISSPNFEGGGVFATCYSLHNSCNDCLVYKLDQRLF